MKENLSLLYRGKPFLNAEAMKSLYFSFFHSYLRYENIAWCSTSMAKLKKIFSKQKRAIKAMLMTPLDYKNLKSEEIMDKLVILNIYELNLYHSVNLMFREKIRPYQKYFGQNFK